MSCLLDLGARAQAARPALAAATTDDKNKALRAIADALRTHVDAILAANEKDMKAAGEKGLSGPMQARLKLTPDKIEGIAKAVEAVVDLPDPVGVVHAGSTRPNGLRIQKVAVPMGVVAMIFESRPNVTVDAAILCLKSGNACILRGGSEAIHSNIALAGVMREAVASCGLPADSIQFIEDTARETATELMRLTDYVDLLIPRGSAGLIQSVVKNATVPVIETGAGVCHVYVDRDADLDMAVEIAHTGKISYPAACNSVETLLVHVDVAGRFLPRVAAKMHESGVVLYGCDRVRAILPDVDKVTGESFFTEYSDLSLNMKIVDSSAEAMTHIAHYGTHHSDTIVTDSYPAACLFTATVDSAVVYVNASPRFTDGGEFGMGAEIGISTQKLHVRGPMGLSELTTTKYIVQGSGQVR